jgi:hypothetical protein
MFVANECDIQARVVLVVVARPTTRRLERWQEYHDCEVLALWNIAFVFISGL